jgi:hypothetical protein
MAVALALLASGCATGSPSPISQRELAEAQTFPYYTVYWVGMRFGPYTLTAADGRMDYQPAYGDSVYYGECLRTGKILAATSCVLPLQVTTSIYGLHRNTSLGPQQNAVIRGVPAVIYDGGAQIELYSGRLAIDVLANTSARALRAAELLRPLNSPGSAQGPLPAPVYCPGLSGAIDAQEQRVLAALPRHVCRETAAATASQERIKRERSE